MNWVKTALSAGGLWFSEREGGPGVSADQGGFDSFSLGRKSEFKPRICLDCNIYGRGGGLFDILNSLNGFVSRQRVQHGPFTAMPDLIILGIVRIFCCTLLFSN